MAAESSGAPTVGVPLGVAVEEMDLVWVERAEAGLLIDRSALQYQGQLTAFTGYAIACGITDTSELTSTIVDAWVSAPVSAVSPGSRGRAGQDASPATRRGRQTAIRMVLSEWASRGWVDPGVIPTQVISKTPRQATCPLTPAEAARVRLAGQLSLTNSLHPALVALALTGITNADIARIVVADLDQAGSTIRAGGHGGAIGRSLVLQPADLVKLGRHADALCRAAGRRKTDFDPAEMPIALPTAPRTHRLHVTETAVRQHLYRALKVAGIARVGVTPGSMLQYGANRCYAITNRVEDVADLLGLTSLDAARTYVDRAWQAAWGDAVRAEHDGAGRLVLPVPGTGV